MLRHVVERALLSDAERVFVAVDDEKLAKAVDGTDAIPVMTSTIHESGTDRVFEVINSERLGDSDLIVNVQGDEPLISPSVINQVAQLLFDRPKCGVATLYSMISNTEEIFDPNMVKVVLNSESHAMYFSRAPLPWDRVAFAEGEPHNIKPHWYRHVGIYAYRGWALRKFVTWRASLLEQIEHLEQLRFLENGMSIVLEEVTESVSAGVDTAHDLARVRKIFAAD